MTGQLDPEVARLFGGGHYTHLTTLRQDGSPQSRPVWTIVHEGQIAFFTQPQSPKARHLERDPRVSLSVVDNRNPYVSAWARGRVETVIEREEALPIIDRISYAYTRAPFPMRSGNVYLVDVEASGTMTLPFTHRPA